jgi:hypothetical protein
MNPSWILPPHAIILDVIISLRRPFLTIPFVATGRLVFGLQVCNGCAVIKSEQVGNKFDRLHIPGIYVKEARPNISSISVDPLACVPPIVRTLADPRLYPYSVL